MTSHDDPRRAPEPLDGDADPEVEQLRAGLVHRTDIGIAIGILMERFDLDRERAFHVLSRLSQEHNVKLHTLAADLTETRQLPGHPR